MTTMLDCKSIADVRAELAKVAEHSRLPLDREVAAILLDVLPAVLRATSSTSDAMHASSLVGSVVASVVGSVAGMHLPPHVRPAFAATVFDTARSECLLALRLHIVPPANSNARPL